MNHRSYGESKDCKGCRFWSEMMAGTDPYTGALRAVCLSMSSVQAGKWTIGSNDRLSKIAMLIEKLPIKNVDAIDAPAECVDKAPEDRHKYDLAGILATSDGMEILYRRVDKS